jgi:hypothetical protein
VIKMILIGDEIIPSQKFYRVTSTDDIKQTPPNSTVEFVFDAKLAKYCAENSVNYATSVSSIKDAIYANALQTLYILVEKELAPTIQKIATEYMFDSKVLVYIKNSDDIEWVALNSIDGAIYR